MDKSVHSFCFNKTELFYLSTYVIILKYSSFQNGKKKFSICINTNDEIHTLKSICNSRF